MVGVDVSCSGFMEAGSRRSLGLRPMASSMGVLPIKVASRSDLCQSGLVQVSAGGIHQCQETFLEQSCSIRPWCMWSCWNSLHVVHSVECLQVVRMVESHICTNRLRVHLERVHPLMKFNNHFRCSSTLCMDRLSFVM